LTPDVCDDFGATREPEAAGLPLDRILTMGKIFIPMVALSKSCRKRAW
jgi:hypothetical protein